METVLLEPATEEFKQNVCKKYNTSLQQVKKDVEVLKDWIRQQPHLPQGLNDTLLTTFLIASKNRMERAKEKIEKYHEARGTIPDFFRDLDPESDRVHQSNKEILHFVLPKLTPDGCRVHWNVFLDSGHQFDIPGFFKRFMAIEVLRYNTESFTLGDYIVMDCKLFSAYHLLRMTPTLIRDLMYSLQEALPFSIKGVFLINSPSYVELGIAIIKPFMKKKIFQRMYAFKEGPEVLDTFFPRKLLPRDYGGEEETSQQMQDAWNQLLREKRDWIMKEETFTVDEKKRIGGSKNNEVYEMQGSFKSLCVD